MIDLVCLVADKNIEAVIGATLHRHEALGTRAITNEIIVHPQRDSACFHDPLRLLRPFRGEAQHALVIFDHAWEGVPDGEPIALEALVTSKLETIAPAWGRTIVVDPEIEAWLFHRSPRLDEKLGWANRTPSLGDELARRGWWPMTAAKPADPKAALEWALRQVSKPRSSSIYRDIGSALGMKDCTDPSFGRFRAILQAWFPKA